MAGVGPSPQSRSARRNKDPKPSTVLEFRRGEQPALPDSIDWHPQTILWWTQWAEWAEALEESGGGFTVTDWSFLLDTALMHHAMWSKGQWTLAAEVRLRVAKFGATPEDRARLRIQFADADAKDAKRPAPNTSARSRRGPLTAV